MAIADRVYERITRALSGVGVVIRASSTSVLAEDPTITSGSGAPSVTEPAGSFYLRTSNAAWYRRIGGAWELVMGAAGTLVADVISELTSGAGVTVDSLLIKDGKVDLNGVAGALILDADADTLIGASTDDQIDITINAAIDFVLTANTFTAVSGSTIATNTIAETTAASGVTIDALLVKDGYIAAADNQGVKLGNTAAAPDDTIAHDGTNTIWSHITGDLIFDNVLVTGSTIMLLGTDTSAVDFQVQNNSGAALLTVTPTSASGGTTVASGLRAVSAVAPAITGVTTLTAADSGGVFSVAKSSAYAITLPTPAQGLRFKFLILDTGANAVTFSNGSAHLYGQIQEAGTVPIAMTGTTLTAAASGSVGDWLLFEGIDATHYLVTGGSIAASKFTIA